MYDQEEKNFEESSVKQAANKGNNILKDEIRKKGAKKIIKFFLNKKVLMIGLIIIAVIIAILIFCEIVYYITNDFNIDTGNNAKAQALSTSYETNASTTRTDENGNVVSQIVLKPNSANTGYEIAYNDDEDFLKKVKNEIEKKTSIPASRFSEFELGVLGALMDNGADFDYYTEEELHCLPLFIKAEACTQYLDLRSNNEKFNGAHKTENYSPRKIEDLADEELPGVILVQRTNTSNDTPQFLEYAKKSTFDGWVTNNDPKAISHFTIDDKGELIVAQWSHIKITVTDENGNTTGWPDGISEEEKVQPKDEYIIRTTKIPYKDYIKKHIMPFDFLLQLLIYTDDVEFCKEFTNTILSSKIIINIQEEETVTTRTEKRKYTTFKKTNKNIDYHVTSDEENINFEEATNLLLKKNNSNEYDIDDEGANCTVYEEPVVQPIIITETYKEHTYNFELIESDTWIGHYKKSYTNGETKTNTSQEQYEGGYAGEYKKMDASSYAYTQNVEEQLSGSDKDDVDYIIIPKREYYDTKKSLIMNPLISVWRSGGQYHKLRIEITPNGSFSAEKIIPGNYNQYPYGFFSEDINNFNYWETLTLNEQR